METTWIFRSVKLHQKSAWKRRGNSSKFGLGRIRWNIHVESTSIRSGVPIGFILKNTVSRRQERILQLLFSRVGTIIEISKNQIL